jgi:hypothetical protein
MMQLSQQGMERARTFIRTSARPLEQALFAYHLDSGSVEEIYTQLARYTNPDGGFGCALEPDLRTPESSVYVTTIGLQILRDLRTPPSHQLVEGAIRYLLNTYDPERQRWPIIPPAAGDAPHAPWWSYDEELPERFGQFLANPRAEILGYLYDYARLAPRDLLEQLTPAVLSHLDTLPETMEMHDLLCYVRLAETRTLPEEAREQLLRKLTPAVDRVVARGAAAWQQYGLTPLSVVGGPDSPFAAMLAPAIEVNLDYEIERQQVDGSWGPPWSWGDMFPEAWNVAERDWKGVLTVATLRRLRAFKRLA